MNKSESIKTLAVALHKAHEKITGVAKTASNPFFKSKYADLASVVEAVKPALQSEGIVVIQGLQDAEGGVAIETMLLEERRYPPPEDFAAQANAQADIYERDFEEFWETEARERVTWFEPFSELLDWKPPYAKWYLGGKLNVCFNCVDRHVVAGNGGKVAYFWEGEPEDDRVADAG